MKKEPNKVIEPQNRWVYESASNPLYFNIIPHENRDNPKIICKYFPLKDYSIEALKNKHLYGSHPFQLNDLFDCNPDLINFNKITFDHYLALYDVIEKERVKEIFENDRKNDHIEFRNLFHSIVFQKIGIISFTEDNLNLPMWSLYNNNKGFLINFNVEELKKENYFYGPFPINYMEELKKIPFMEPYLSVLYQTNVKISKWENENEWRLLALKKDMNSYNPMGKEIYKGTDNRLFKYKEQAIESIFLGFNLFKNLQSNRYTIKFNYSCLENKFIKNLKKLLEYLSLDFDKDIYQIGIDTENLKIGPNKIKFEKIDSRTYKIIYL